MKCSKWATVFTHNGKPCLAVLGFESREDAHAFAVREDTSNGRACSVVPLTSETEYTKAQVRQLAAKA